MSDIFIKLSVDLREDGTLKKLRGAPLSVFIALGMHIDGKGECYPSVETLSKRTGYTTRQVTRALNTLVALNLISRTPTYFDGRQSSNTYRVLRYFSFGRPEWAADSSGEADE